MEGLLEGIKVVDMGHVVAVPAAGRTFSDWGAEVIKVEPLSGEYVRGSRRAYGVDLILEVNGGKVNFQFESLNAGKKAIALDLRQEAGREILHKLIQKCDVFMTNYETGTLKKLKADYLTLSQLNPKLVYATLSGYGSSGPDKDERGFDIAAGWARSGAMLASVLEPGGIPPPARHGLVDMIAGMHMVAGILAALVHRDKTGKGQELELSLYHSAVWSTISDIQPALMGRPFQIVERTKSGNPLANIYETKDKKWLLLTMGQSGVYWAGFCRALERPELEKDPRFKDMVLREKNCEELIRIIDEVFATQDRDEWRRRFKDNNCICGLVQSTSEVVTDPQALANDFFVEIDNPVSGRLKIVNSPIKFHQNPSFPKGPAPQVGQQTEEILLELGYSWDDISILKDKTVIP
jgi:crotonobetainyl-CoA:carnitine CoA-transferase CaiB-like acyl-CoA transferase